jgi:hypothetical protein
MMPKPIFRQPPNNSLNPTPKDLGACALRGAGQPAHWTGDIDDKVSKGNLICHGCIKQ